MKTKLEKKKMYVGTINQYLENVTNSGVEEFVEIGYKDVLEFVRSKHENTSYEVLNYVKELEGEGIISFYKTTNDEKMNIGLATETYRLKIEEKYQIESSDYLPNFMNEALILDLVSS